jgi:hypothetical protein
LAKCPVFEVVQLAGHVMRGAPGNLEVMQKLSVYFMAKGAARGAWLQPW